MKSFFVMMAVLAGLTAPALAQGQGAALVMRYKAPDGTEKTLPMTIPGQTISLRECKQALPEMVPVFKRQLGDKKNFPEFAGWEFVGASCENFSNDLLTTVE